MFRNSVQNVAGNQMAPSISRFMRTMNLSTCVYYSDLWFRNNPDSNKCQEILGLVCRCLDQIYNCINRLILRLHKVTCLLLRQKPARRNDLDPLPDILKGTWNVLMSLVNLTRNKVNGVYWRSYNIYLWVDASLLGPFVVNLIGKGVYFVSDGRAMTYLN